MGRMHKFSTDDLTTQHIWFGFGKRKLEKRQSKTNEAKYYLVIFGAI